MLSPSDLEFIKSLRNDPRWDRVLKQLKQDPPTYRPSDDSEDKLVHGFIYKSGAYEENKRILTILGVKNDASRD